MEQSHWSQNIVAWGIAFVFAWFGMNEILSPSEWTAYVPSFLGTGSLIIDLVVIHSAALGACALLLILDIGRMYVGILASLLILDIVVALVMQNGLDPISVRYIGLFCAALSLVFSKKKNNYAARMTTSAKPGIFPEKYS